MKQDLDWSYNITVDNMIGLTKEDEFGDYKLETTSFMRVKSGDLEEVKMNVLQRRNVDGDRRQIMKMNDGKFVLETETNGNQGEIDYYFSEELEDL